VKSHENLPVSVDKGLTKLLILEIILNYRGEQLKRNLEQSYDFTIQGAFHAVDDWLYNYIDITNLKRFFIKMGYSPTKALLKSVIRRIDIDGDGKLKKPEFAEGIKSQFTLVNHFGSKLPFAKPTRVFMEGDIGHETRAQSRLLEKQAPLVPQSSSASGAGDDKSLISFPLKLELQPRKQRSKSKAGGTSLFSKKSK